jgi:hypothetical protein
MDEQEVRRQYEELRSSGLTHGQAVSQIAAGISSEPDGDRSVLGETAAGAAFGLSQAATSLGEGLGLLGEAVLPEALEAPATALKEFSQDVESSIEERLDPSGTAGTVGRIGGRVVGEALTTIGSLGLGRLAMMKYARPQLEAIQRTVGGSRARQVGAALVAEAPVNVPRAFSYAEETGNPLSSELALEFVGTGLGALAFGRPTALSKTDSAGRLGDFSLSGDAPPKTGSPQYLSLLQRARSKFTNQDEAAYRAILTSGNKKAAYKFRDAIATLEGTSSTAGQYYSTHMGPILARYKNNLKEVGQAAQIRADSEARKQTLQQLPSLKRRLAVLRTNKNPSNKTKLRIKQLEKKISDYEQYVKYGSTGQLFEEAAEKLRIVEADPTLMKGSDELQEYFGKLVDMNPAVTRGRLRGSRDFYSPLRLHPSEYTSTGRRAGDGTNRFAPKRIEQSLSRRNANTTGRKLNDPFQVAFQDTLDTFGNQQKQRVNDIFYGSLLDHGGQWVDSAGRPIIKMLDDEAAEASRKAGGRVVSTKVLDEDTGERVVRHFEVFDNDLFDGITQVDQAAAGRVMKIMQKVANLKRQFITLLPDFSALALARDLPLLAGQRAVQRGTPAALEAGAGAGVGAVAGASLDEEDRLGGALTGALLGVSGGVLARPTMEIADAMTSIARWQNAGFARNTSGAVAEIQDVVLKDLGFGDPKTFEIFRQAGGLKAGLTNTQEELTKIINARMSPEEKASIISFPKNFFDALKFIGMAAENAPRLAMFKQLMKEGATSERAILASADVTLPFQKKGNLKSVKDYASVTPFLNASLQSWDKLTRLMSGDIIKATDDLADPTTLQRAAQASQTILALGATITAPTIALWNINKDNPEYWDLPLYQKNLFWAVPKSEGGFWLIPKPFELGYAFGSLFERGLDALAQSGRVESASPIKNVADFGMLTDDIRGSLEDFSKSAATGALPIPAAIQPLIEQVINKDLFLYRDIEPQYLQTRDPSRRYTSRTSTLSRDIAAAIPGGVVSPLRVQALLNSFGGTTARRSMDAYDAIGASQGRATPLSRYPDAERVQRVLGSARFNTLSQDVGQIEYQAYNILKRSSDRASDFRRIQREGLPRERVDYYRDKFQDELAISRSLKSYYARMRALRSERNEVAESETLSDDQKRRRLDQLNERGRRLGTDVLVRINNIVK